jgi:hypothetical protein
MKRSIKKNIAFSFIGILLISASIGYLIWNKPHRDIKDANAIETNAIDLYNVFIYDSSKAKLTYLNKTIKVSGIVSGVFVNQKKQKIFLLKTAMVGASVNCTMEEHTSNYKEGDNISLKGICAGYISGDTDMGLPGDVFLIRCYRSN